MPYMARPLGAWNVGTRMRKRFSRLNGILHYTGHLLEVLGLVLLLPILVVFLYWDERGDGRIMTFAFFLPAGVSLAIGFVLRNVCRSERLDTVSSMLMCAIGWLACSAIGAIPFVIGIEANYLDAYFEAMSGFTTTGITVFAWPINTFLATT